MEALDNLQNLLGVEKKFPTEKYTRFLLNYVTKDQIPMYHVHSDVKIHNNIAEIRYEQYYFNHSEEPIEAEYIFPVHADAVFGGLELRYKNKVIQSRVEIRETAKAMYDDAIAAEKTAVISHPSRKDKDIVRLNVGGIPAKAQIILVCTFYQRLQVDDLSWMLHIPSKIIPRYMGDELAYINSGHQLKGTSKKKVTNEEKEDHIEDIDEAHRAYYQKQSFSWSLGMEINSSSSLERITSPTHQIDVQFKDESATQAIISIANQ